MIYVQATTGFDHGGLKRRGDIFAVSEQVAAQLIRANLVKNAREQKENPQVAAFGSASASQAAEALPQMIAEKPKRGKKKKPVEESSQ